MSEILISPLGLLLVTSTVVFLENNGLLQGSVRIDWEKGTAKACTFTGVQFHKTSGHLGCQHFAPLPDPC